MKAAIGALGFVGVTGVAGGTEMMLFPYGNVFVGHEWLDDIPFVGSYLVPGAVLAVGIGAGSLFAAYRIARRPRWSRLGSLERRTGRHWSWTATALAGLGLTGWILLEVAWIPERSAIEAVYGVLGLTLLALCWSPSMRRHMATDSPSGRHLRA